jgi:hypothetical protein
MTRCSKIEAAAPKHSAGDHATHAPLLAVSRALWPGEGSEGCGAGKAKACQIPQCDHVPWFERRNQHATAPARDRINDFLWLVWSTRKLGLGEFLSEPLKGITRHDRWCLLTREFVERERLDLQSQSGSNVGFLGHPSQGVFGLQQHNSKLV